MDKLAILSRSWTHAELEAAGQIVQDLFYDGLLNQMTRGTGDKPSAREGNLYRPYEQPAEGDGW